MKKELRSLIHEKFPLELRVKLDLLSRRRDIRNKEKQEELMKLLREFNITDVTPLGPGTNRYAFKMNGFVIKCATDHDGKIDNLKEFKMAKRLQPYVTKVYEVSENGTLLVAQYIQPFTSFAEMLKYADKIREILRKFSSVYLIGDVGISSDNYSNWGLPVGSEDPVCLDFAYVYEVNSNLFICKKCNANAMLLPDKDFVNLYCSNPTCGKKTLFADIRGRIGNDIHNHEIGDLGEEGYRLTDSHVETELDETRSNYLVRMRPKKKESKKKQVTEEVVYDEFVMEHSPRWNKEEENMYNNILDMAGAMASSINDSSIVIKATSAVLKNDDTTNKDILEGKVAFSGKVEEADESNIHTMKLDDLPDEDDIELVDPDDEEEGSSFLDQIRTFAKGDSISNESEEVEEEVEEEESDDSDIAPADETSKWRFDYDEKAVEAVGVAEDFMNPPEEPAVANETSEEVEETPVVKASATIVEETNVEEPKQKEKPTGSKVNPQKFWISRNLMENGHQAISILSNSIAEELHSRALFDEIMYNLNTRERKCLYPETFYKKLQNAIFKSLIEFLGCEETEVPNKNGAEGTRICYNIPHDIPADSPIADSVKFIDNIWTSRIMVKCDNANEIIPMYDKQFDSPKGIDPAWLNICKFKIKNKFAINDSGVVKIIDAIASVWCRSDEDNVQVEQKESDVKLAIDDVKELQPEIGNDNEKESEENKNDINNDIKSNSSNISTSKIGNDEKLNPLAGSFVIDKENNSEVVNDERCNEKSNESNNNNGSNICSSNNDSSSSSDNNGNESYDDSDQFVEDDQSLRNDDDSYQYLTIEVYPSAYDDGDVIKIKSGDMCGSACIPLYANLGEIEEEMQKNPLPSTDDRNGDWDWLTHVMPDMMFTTDDPETYSDINENDNDVSAKIAILGKEDDGLYRIGIYNFTGIYIIDEDNNRNCEPSDELLKVINYLIKKEIAGTAMSTLNCSMNVSRDLIDTEEYILQLIEEGNNGKDEDEEGTTETVEHTDEVDNLDKIAKDEMKESVEDITDAEQAAIESMMRSIVDEVEEKVEAPTHQEVRFEKPVMHSKIESSDCVEPIRRRGRIR